MSSTEPLALPSPERILDSSPPPLEAPALAPLALAPTPPNSSAELNNLLPNFVPLRLSAIGLNLEETLLPKLVPLSELNIPAVLPTNVPSALNLLLVIFLSTWEPIDIPPELKIPEVIPPTNEDSRAVVPLEPVSLSTNLDTLTAISANQLSVEFKFFLSL